MGPNLGDPRSPTAELTREPHPVLTLRHQRTALESLSREQPSVSATAIIQTHQSNSSLHRVLQDHLRPVAGEAAEMTGTLFIRDRAKKNILQAQVFSLFHC